MIVEIRGRINKAGKLEIELPGNLPTGEVRVVIESLETVWTDEELAEFTKIEPMTGAEIVEAGLTGGWEDMEITDGAAWIQQQRRQRQERRVW